MSAVDSAKVARLGFDQITDDAFGISIRRKVGVHDWAIGLLGLLVQTHQSLLDLFNFKRVHLQSLVAFRLSRSCEINSL